MAADETGGVWTRGEYTSSWRMEGTAELSEGFFHPMECRCGERKFPSGAGRKGTGRNTEKPEGWGKTERGSAEDQ